MLKHSQITGIFILQSRTRDQSNSVHPHGKKPNKSKPKPLYFWDCADVNKWMKKWCGALHEKYGELLLEQEVTGMYN